MDPEQVAYWFFRLNGCLTITNFIIHSRDHPQETEVDILAVRFPHRRELAESGERMDDHPHFDGSDRIDLVIAEAKANKPCELNGPWTKPERRNMQRQLYAIGVVPEDRVDEVAKRLYQDCFYEDPGGHLRVRLFAIGAESCELKPAVVQMTWDELLGFIYKRFRDYLWMKGDHPQWDACGHRLYHLARFCECQHEFIRRAKDEMGLTVQCKQSSRQRSGRR